jgi:hypothetical protein
MVSLIECYLFNSNFYVVYISQNVVRKIENVDADQSKPKKDCVIEDSGAIPVEEPFNVEKDAAEE